MADRETLSLRASCYGSEPVRFAARVVALDRAARGRRAAAVFFPLLAGALLSLPVPGWHLLGVPGFAIAAVVLGRRRLRQTRIVEAIEGPCPSCRGRPDYPVPGPDLPFTVRCPSCGEFLNVRELR